MDILPTKNLQKMLKTLKKDPQHTSYEPVFIPGRGFCYEGLESFANIEEQIELFKALEKVGVTSSNKKISASLLSCGSCNYPYFSIKNLCRFCRSSNVILGTVIEHDLCGNVDFDYKYNSADGKLICDRCNRELKALGVDYSKTSRCYKCIQCNSILPSTEQYNGCLNCGKFSAQDDLHLLQLFTYTINPEKLLSMIDKNDYLNLLRERLTKTSIKVSFPGTVKGESKLEHQFDLVVYNDDRNGTPVLVGDFLELPSQDNDSIDAGAETLVLSFIGKCIDINARNKTFMSFSKFSDRTKRIANAHGVHLVEISNDGGITDNNGDGHERSHRDHVSETADTISRLCREIPKENVRDAHDGINQPENN
jgi:hypothetical protein